MKTIDPQTGIFSGIRPVDYHRDCCKSISLSASIAIKMVTGCPLHAWASHPRLGNQRSDPSRVMQFGTVCHYKFSGVETEIEVIAAADYKTKLAQQARDVAMAAGKTPILEHEVAEAQAVADSARKSCADAGLALAGEWERVVMWEEDGIQCRGLLDHLDLDSPRPYILDLKTTTDANPSILGRKIVDEAYDIQCAAYLSAVERIRPDLAGRVPFFFCFVETGETAGRHLASIVQPDEQMLTLGRMRWRQAKMMWRRLLAEYGKNPWPGWPAGITTVYPTTWQLHEAELYLDSK